MDEGPLIVQMGANYYGLYSSIEFHGLHDEVLHAPGINPVILHSPQNVNFTDIIIFLFQGCYSISSWI